MDITGDGSGSVETATSAGVELDDGSFSNGQSDGSATLDGAGQATVGSSASADLEASDAAATGSADAGAFVDVDGAGSGTANAETASELAVEGQDPVTADAIANGFASGQSGFTVDVDASNDVSYDADGSTADAAAGVNASSGEEDVMANTVAKSQTIVTPNSILSMSKSRSVARDAAGEEGMASVISRAMALNTPGTVKVDADTRNHSSIEGEGEATAFGDAAATVDEAGNMTADTSASSLVELQ